MELRGECRGKGIRCSTTPGAEYHCGNAFRITGAELRKLADGAFFVYDRSAFRNPDTELGLLPEGMDREHSDNTALCRPPPPTECALTRGSPEEWPREVYHRSKLVAMCGPAFSMYDAQLRPQKRAAHPFLVVSIAGINFAYMPADRERYPKGPADAEGEMKRIWYVALSGFATAGTHWPILCAIGCGAFKGHHADVPRHWARALAAVLRDPTLCRSFHGVVISVPTFGRDNNFEPFVEELTRGHQNLAVPVVITERHGMVEMAEWITATGRRAGMLNPSDVSALVLGGMGMFYHSGHVALEEILALRTTLLLQHRDLNPEVWTDVKRRHGVNVTTVS